MNPPISKWSGRSAKRVVRARRLFVPTLLCISLLSVSSVFAAKSGGFDNPSIKFANSYGNTKSLAGNRVQVSREVMEYVFGAYTESKPAIVSENVITVTSSVSHCIFGGMVSADGKNVLSGKVENNTAIVDWTSVNKDKSPYEGIIYGGFADSSSGNGTVSMSANANHVSSTVVHVESGIVGGKVLIQAEAGTAEASNNTVTISSSSTSDLNVALYGGQVDFTALTGDAVATVQNNTLTASRISAASRDGGVYGGFSVVSARKGSASVVINGNSVAILGKNYADIKPNLYGGYAHVYAGNGTSKVSVSENTVAVSGINVEIKRRTYGGYVLVPRSLPGNTVTNVIEANRNTVDATGDSKIVFNGGIFGGYAQGNGTNGSTASTANRNKVTLSGVALKDINNDGIYGGFALADALKGEATAAANNNQVAVSRITTENVVDGSLCGGSSKAKSSTKKTAAAADGNQVSVTDVSVSASIYGGNSDTLSSFGKAAATANDNRVTISGSKDMTIEGNVFGGKTKAISMKDEAIAETNNNTVVISGSSVSVVGNVYGGCYFETDPIDGTIRASADANRVTVSGASIGNVYVGHAVLSSSDDGKSATTNAVGNTLILSDGSKVSHIACAGYAEVSSKAGDASAKALKNAVVASGKSVINGELSGAYARAYSDKGNAEATVNENTTEISDNATVMSTLYGGFALASASDGRQATAKSSGNAMTVLKQSTIRANVYGGYAVAIVPEGGEALARASNNTVTIADSVVQADIFGGFVFATTANGGKVSADSVGNTVKLTGLFAIHGSSSLYGGYAKGMPSDNKPNLFSGNTLVLDARKVNKMTVAKVVNFETINIQAGNIGNGDVVLSATQKVILGNGEDKGTTVIFESIENPSLVSGDRIILINNVEGVLANEGMQEVNKADTFAFKYEATVKKEGEQIVAHIGKEQKLNGETKVLSESRVAGLAFVNTGTDLLVDATKAKGLFGVMRGGHMRYNTGSSVEVDGVNLIAGAVKTFAGTASEITAGFFIEGGWGDTVTHNTIGGKKLKGKGDSRYYGAGILGRLEKTQGMLRGAYADVSFRGGRLSDDYTNKDVVTASGQNLRCDLDSTYVATHAGVGYQWNLTDTLRADTSVRYMWTHVQGKTVQTLGDTYKFDAMNSHRVRAGVRFDHLAHEAYMPYIGLAWEYEFDGKSKGSVRGQTLDSANLRGSSGVVNMGVQFKPEVKVPLTVNAGFVGYFGQHKGVAGQIRMNYVF